MDDASCTNGGMGREDGDRLASVWGDDWLLSLLERDRDAFAKTGDLIVKAYKAGRCRDEACPLHGAAADPAETDDSTGS